MQFQWWELRLVYNEKYRDIFYNEIVKERFLNTLHVNTRKIFERLFKRSYNIESVLDRDICNFNLREFSEYFYHLKSSTLNSLRSNKSNISSYVEWAIREGYRNDNSNPLEGLPKDFLEKFVSKDYDDYISKEQIDKIIRKCVNKQDAVILSLIFEGVTGNELWEIRNLTPNEVDFENYVLTLRDDNKNVRQIEVSEQCIDLVEQAIKETVYYKRNGEPSDNSRAKPTTELIDTGFVIKPSRVHNVRFEQIDGRAIYQRLKKISDIFEVRPLASYLKIKYSGMIYLGYKLYKEEGKLDREQYMKICKQFNVYKIILNGEETYNWTLLKELINMETIKHLYPDTTTH